MTEEMKYEVTGRIWDVEHSHYPAVAVAGVSGLTEIVAFGYLSRYISGENPGRRKNPMTTPVLISEKIPMTAPVISNTSTMSLMMPR